MVLVSHLKTNAPTRQRALYRQKRKHALIDGLGHGRRLQTRPSLPVCPSSLSLHLLTENILEGTLHTGPTANSLLSVLYPWLAQH